MPFIRKDKKFNDAYEDYKRGLSISQVAKTLGSSRQSVFEAFKNRGFILRANNKRPHQTFNELRFTLRNNGYYSLTVGKRTLMHRYVWEFYNGKIPEGWDIHHINNKKDDNRIENLECLSKAEHTRKYSPHNNQFTRGRVRCS